MEGKDNRSLGKRHQMKQMKYKRTQKLGGGGLGGQNTTSSSTPPLRGIADVADSSDERFVQGEGYWLQQKRSYDLDELDLLDEMSSAQAQMHAADFSTLSQMPTAVDGHFKFSSEKNWDAASDIDNGGFLKSTEASEYFTLNLKLLNAGLRTIPFHKRMDYGASMFTAKELAQMEKDAEVAEKQYQLLVEGAETNPQINIIGGSTEGGSAKSDRSHAMAINGSSETVKESGKANEKSDTDKNVGATSTPNPQLANSNDIQEWLDNVLEEGN